VGSTDPALAEVLEAVPALAGLERDVTPITLGITNRNFRVDVGGDSYVVRLAGRDTELLGIDRSAEFAAASAAAAAGVGPEVIAFLPELGALITRFVEAERLSEDDLEQREVIEGVVHAVHAIHAMTQLPSRFDPFQVVREYRATAEGRGVNIPSEYDEAISIADRIRKALRSSPMTARPCHNDLLNANFLVRDGRVLIVDYEYAGMGDPFFDLGNLAVNNGLSDRAQEAMLDAYFGRVTSGAIARLALMRIVSDFREAMWGVVQQALSVLDVDYVEYARRHFTRCLENAGGADFVRWLSDAAVDP
jgi:thiamine kinase-like enzyme